MCGGKITQWILFFLKWCIHGRPFVSIQERIQIENGALTIANLSVADSGTFQCIAENKHGLASSSARLSVVGKARCTCLTAFLKCFTFVRSRTVHFPYYIPRIITSTVLQQNHSGFAIRAYSSVHSGERRQLCPE